VKINDAVVKGDILQQGHANSKKQVMRLMLLGFTVVLALCWCGGVSMVLVWS
jgi:hypothetical protein